MDYVVQIWFIGFFSLILKKFTYLAGYAIVMKRNGIVYKMIKFGMVVLKLLLFGVAITEETNAFFRNSTVVDKKMTFVLVLGKAQDKILNFFRVLIPEKMSTI